MSDEFFDSSAQKIQTHTENEADMHSNPFKSSSLPPQNAENMNLDDDCLTIDTDTEPEVQPMDIFSYICNYPRPVVHHYKLPFKTRQTPDLTLVLDLDETLIHSSFTPVDNPDHIIELRQGDRVCKIYVKYRPGLLEFLELASQRFELVVFTASNPGYADQILNKIDPFRRVIRYRLYRDSCVEVKGNYVKDLRVLGRDLSRVIIVDNSVTSFAFQLENGVPIKTWVNDPLDCELGEILQLAESLKQVRDVRPYLCNFFRLTTFNVN